MTTEVKKRDLAEEVRAAFAKRGYMDDPVRQKALDTFLAVGFPGPKTEEYRFTPVTRALEKTSSFASVAAHPLKPASLGIVETPCNILAFVNGKYDPATSQMLDKSIRITAALPAFSTSTDPFCLLNNAFAEEEVQIQVDDNVKVEHPLAIVHYFDGAGMLWTNPRWNCRIGTGSSLTIVEYTRYGGATRSFHNAHSWIELEKSSALNFITIQDQPGTEIGMNNSTIQVASNAKVNTYTFTFEGGLIRNNLSLLMDGEGIDARLFGLYLLSGNSFADNHTVVDHRKPNSVSNELYKGVMDGNAKGVFNGKVFVRPDAQKTNAFQSNRNILLSETSTINTKPQLEIWADDVKCSHGCTTGKLDEQALFYLQSRGISRNMAIGMMLYAFATETFATLPADGLAALLKSRVSEKLGVTVEL